MVGVYRAGSLKTEASELATYISVLVAAQEVIKGDSQPADDYEFFYRNGRANNHLERGLFVQKEIRSAVKSVEFINDRMSYIIVRVHWCDDIVLNVHAPTEDKRYIHLNLSLW
jgi:hypothetical protein